MAFETIFLQPVINSMKNSYENENSKMEIPFYLLSNFSAK